MQVVTFRDNIEVHTQGDFTLSYDVREQFRLHRTGAEIEGTVVVVERFLPMGTGASTGHVEIIAVFHIHSVCDLQDALDYVIKRYGNVRIEGYHSA